MSLLIQFFIFLNKNHSLGSWQQAPTLNQHSNTLHIKKKKIGLCSDFMCCCRRMEEKASGLEEKDIASNLKERVWLESKKLWRIAFPAMLTKMTQFGALVVTQAIIGHIGEVELAAYALIQIINIRFAQGMLVLLLFSLFLS